jgi:hypothetical protein
MAEGDWVELEEAVMAGYVVQGRGVWEEQVLVGLEELVWEAMAVGVWVVPEVMAMAGLVV